MSALFKHTEKEMPVDLLLINASNLPYEPFYPYAFVMLTARARKAGLRVKRLELSNLTDHDVDLWLKTAIETCQPRMVGFTLRQTDSYALEEYLDDTFAPYYPIDAIGKIADKVRALTDAPLILGGYGFTLHARQILSCLDLDLGIKGDVDPLFTNFEDILANRNLNQVPNLLYRHNGDIFENERHYFSPLNAPEYDEELIEEMIGHYGRVICYGRNYLTLFNRGNPICFGNDGHSRQMPTLLSQVPSIPIEVARGCRYNCYFCSEPVVKGHQVFFRDPDVIEEEVRFLVSKNLREFWFVCSEINMGDNSFALTLAERMLKINQTLKDHPLVWKSYHIPRWFSKKDLDLMYRSGFVTSWNDFMALDDRQIKQSGAPYRTAHAIEFIENDYAVRKERNSLPALKFSLFLGDVFLTPQYLTQTLRTFHDHHLLEKCGGAACVYGTRIFDPIRNQVNNGDFFTISPDDSKAKPDGLLHPTFHIPKALIDCFGTVEDVISFFNYIINTLLSHNHLQSKDWCLFLARNTVPETILSLFKDRPACFSQVEQMQIDPALLTANVKQKLMQICENNNVESLKTVFYPERTQMALSQSVARSIVAILRHQHYPKLKQVFDFLHLPIPGKSLTPESTSYRLLEILYQRYDNPSDLIGSIGSECKISGDSLDMLAFESILFQYDLILDPKYKRWLFCQENG